MRFWPFVLGGAAIGVAAYFGQKVAEKGGVTEAVQSIGEDVGAAVSKLGDLIAQFEGFSDVPYQDEAGLWTIGYGHLIKPGDGYWSPSNPGGKKSIPRAEAAALLDSDTAVAQAAVDKNVSVSLTENQRDALVSLTYNIGTGNFKTSTLLRLLNSGDYAGAADQFAVWNKVHDPNTGVLVTSNGLVSRREQERETFLA